MWLEATLLPFLLLDPDEDDKAMSASWANNVIPRVTVEAIVALLAPVLKELTEKTYLKSAEVVDIVLGSVSESGFQTASKCRMAGFLCWISWLNLLRIRAEAALTSDQLLYSIRDTLDAKINDATDTTDATTNDGALDATTEDATDAPDATTDDATDARVVDATDDAKVVDAVNATGATNIATGTIPTTKQPLTKMVNVEAERVVVRNVEDEH
ncbi:hypothetical protein Tco_0770318 [Tanacetum coccineum]|uniref:Uncharacterized protein n=1 Tax=Tanacetum coccineum TaxID=301880 RepID=A0ABQ4ZEU7_9ASTR